MRVCCKGLLDQRCQVHLSVTGNWPWGRAVNKYEQFFLFLACQQALMISPYCQLLHLSLLSIFIEGTPASLFKSNLIFQLNRQQLTRGLTTQINNNSKVQKGNVYLLRMQRKCNAFVKYGCTYQESLLSIFKAGSWNGLFSFITTWPVTPRAPGIFCSYSAFS